MFTNNKNLNRFLIGVIFIIVAGFLTVLAFLLSNEINEENIELNVDTHGQEILEANKDVIDSAIGQGMQRVKVINENDHILGSLGAPVQFIVYSDFECPFCAQFSQTVKKVREEFGENVVIAFRHFPITRSHYNAMDAAIASECAAEQGKFWEMHDKIFEDNMTRKMNVLEFKKDAEEIGLDLVQFNQCLDTEKYKSKVEAQMLEGRNVQVTGTPNIFINGQIFPGAYPLDDFVDSQGYEREGLRNIIEKQLNSDNR